MCRQKLDPDYTTTYSDSLRGAKLWSIDVTIGSWHDPAGINKQTMCCWHVYKNALAHETWASTICAHPMISRLRHCILCELVEALAPDAIVF